MTDAAAALAPKPAAEVNTATVAPEAMSWDSRARRVVTLYVPLACFVLILLFPFYWMAVTSFKPNAELYDYKTYNPFWIASPTLDHIRKLLFDTAYPRWVLTTMTVAVVRDRAVPVVEHARRLRHPAAALQGQPVCRPGDLPRLSRAAVDPVHPAGDHGVPASACSTARWR